MFALICLALSIVSATVGGIHYSEGRTGFALGAWFSSLLLFVSYCGQINS